jgi:hypothetical protein
MRPRPVRTDRCSSSTRRREIHTAWLIENLADLSDFANNAHRQAGRGICLASEDPDGVDLVYKTEADIEALSSSPEKNDVQWKVEHYDPAVEFVIGLNEPGVGVTSWYRVRLDWT